MVLFTKVGCEKCEWVKKHVDLDAAGVRVVVLGEENYEGLAELAWFSGVRLAETQLPILAREQEDKLIAGAINIKKFLSKIIE